MFLVILPDAGAISTSAEFLYIQKQFSVAKKALMSVERIEHSKLPTCAFWILAVRNAVLFKITCSKLPLIQFELLNYIITASLVLWKHLYIYFTGK